MRHRNIRSLAAAMLTAATVFATALPVPQAAIAAPYLPVPSFVETDRAPWLKAPDIAVNPPGVAPGNVTAPAVERGYVITGAYLHQFEITGAPEALAEVEAFLRRRPEAVQDATYYRVFATPPILAVQEYEDVKVDALASAAVETVNDLAHTAPVGTDPVDPLWEDGPLADVLILPVDLGVGEVGAAFDEGKHKATMTLESTEAVDPAVIAALGVIAQETEFDPEWSEQMPRCLSRKSNNTAWYDPCEQYASLAKDGSTTRRTVGHKQWGTAKSKGIWTLTDFQVYTQAYSDNPQQWLDWAPPSDSDAGNCRSTTIGVNVNTAVLEHSRQQCDEWDIDKENPRVEFQNWWRGMAARKERNVGLTTASSLPNNVKARNKTKYDYYAW